MFETIKSVEKKALYFACVEAVGRAVTALNERQICW